MLPIHIHHVTKLYIIVNFLEIKHKSDMLLILAITIAKITIALLF